MSEYLVVIEHEADSWGAYCPDLPGLGVVALSQGLSQGGPDSGAPEKLLGAVHQPEAVGNAREAQQPLNLGRAGGEGQSLATLHCALVRGEDDPQAGGVDEMNVVEVEHNDLSGIERVAFDRALQPWCADQIQFATERQHGPVPLLSDLDGELFPYDHKC